MTQRRSEKGQEQDIGRSTARSAKKRSVVFLPSVSDRQSVEEG